MIDAAKQAGVTHIVSMSSLCKPGGPSITNVGLWRWHTLIQAYAEASGVGWTHLRCGFFMENLIGSVSPDRSAFRSLCGGSPLKQGWIAGRDIGAAAGWWLYAPRIIDIVYASVHAHANSSGLILVLSRTGMHKIWMYAYTYVTCTCTCMNVYVYVFMYTYAFLERRTLVSLQRRCSVIPISTKTASTTSRGQECRLRTSPKSSLRS